MTANIVELWLAFVCIVAGAVMLSDVGVTAQSLVGGFAIGAGGVQILTEVLTVATHN